jgi:para-nitrobenzyl esterase
MTGNTPGGKRVAKQLGSSLAAFAKSGNPNNPSIPAWSPYETKRRAVMVIDDKTRQVNDPYRELREMWDKISQPL